MMRAGTCAVTNIPGDRWDRARFWHPQMGVPGKYYTDAAGVLQDIHAFDPALFGISRREATFMDPQQRLLLELTWRALEDANLSVASLQGERVAVYVGASGLDHANLSIEDPAAPGPYFMTGNTLSIVSNRISHVFGLKGPSLTVDTACSSSLVALDHAVRAINSGIVDTAIVGGVNMLLHPMPFVGFAQARMLSPDGLCKAYDNDGIGYVRAEGGAILVLRSSERVAREGDRSRARIVASGINAAGRTNGISLPSREAQAELLMSIYRDAVDPRDVAFVEGHGTGTKVGDPAELWSLGQVIGMRREEPVWIGSIKTNIGHTEPASGLLGVIKAMLALENNYLPASLHFDTPNEDVDFQGLNVRVADKPVVLEKGDRPRLAGINSFGFGGANAHVVIADPLVSNVAAMSTASEVDAPRLLMISAHTAGSLKRLLADYRDRLDTAAAELDVSALIAAASANRSALRHRFVVAAGRAKAIEAIDAHLGGTESLAETGEALSRDPKVALVFSGNGAQWAGMGLEALRHNDAFRCSFERICELFLQQSPIDLKTALSDPELDQKLADTKVAQPLLFAIQAALTDSMVEMGLCPTSSFGHSVGEVAAAYAAGALSLEDAVTVIAKRSLHQDVLAGEGTMAAVKLGEQAAAELIRSLGLDDLEVAAINAPNSVTISGSYENIKLLRERARKRRVAVQPLDINYPFHHPLIDKSRDAFLADMPPIAPRRGDTVFISTVTGTAINGDALTAEYWWRNVRQPVRFQQAAEEAMALGCNVFIEVTPRAILGGYLSEIAKQRSASINVVDTLSRDDGHLDSDPVLQAMARAIACGAAVDPAKVFGKRNAFVSLPELPFERIDLQPDRTSDRADIYGRDSEYGYSLVGWRIDPNGTAWKNHIDAHLFPDLAEHVVDGRSILPGSGFIEIAVSAASQLYGQSRVEISNLEIVRPLELSESRLIELSTLISPETGDLEIRSRERLSEDDWTIHAVARVRKLTASEARPVPILPQIAVTVEIDAKKAYGIASNFGLDYGPHFQLMQRTICRGDRLIEVSLGEPAAPAHPMLGYNLNPVSVDAVFHGLVALFDRFSGDHRGAPYIPVRFGQIRIDRTGATIRRAVIEIDRLSPTSIKARFHLFDADGERVATFEDCRFRRTYLKQRKTLNALSFHYEALSSSVAGRAVPDSASAPDAISCFAHLAETGLDNETLLFNAAIMRSLHDMASVIAADKPSFSADDMPKDVELRMFLFNGLHMLADAGFIEQRNGEWIIDPECPLPPVAELLGELYKDCPDRAVEAVLINDVYCEVLDRLAQGEGRLVVGEDGAPRRDHFLSEATLEHQEIHSVAARSRIAVLLDGVRAWFDQRPSEGSLKILELGSTSVRFSRGLAEVAADHGARLVIYEPDGALRHRLELAFEDQPHVQVASREELAALEPADLVVSASSQLRNLVEADFATEKGVGILSGAQGLLAVVEAPALFHDFVSGLSEGWFARSQAAEFPIGALATVSDWREILSGLGLGSADVTLREMTGGPVITIETKGKATASTAVPVTGSAMQVPVLLVHDGRISADALSAAAAAQGFAAFDVFAASGDLATDKQSFIGFFERHADGPLDVIHVSLPSGAAADGSAVLQDNVLILSAFALALADYRVSLGRKAASVRLLVAAPGGAPVADLPAADAVSSGLWTFLRVLRNEFDFLDVQSIDSGASRRGLVELLADVAAICAPGVSNREWCVGADGGTVFEMRAVPGAMPEANAATTAFESAVIHQQVPSQVSSIRWESYAVPPIGPEEVLVEVAATGLNFRDVMWAMGLLPEEALEDGFAGASIGMEFSGHVVAVGSDVDDLSVGDPVMAIAAAAFATHVAVNRAGVAKLPAGVDPVAAASIPVVFLTAYYAIVELGRARPGETILIHGAAGGVGLAALQVAKHLGLKVIATAGTQEKRRFVEMLGADHIFDSRSLSFVGDVLSVTGGEGVDLVLNSLFGEAMEQSLSLVKPFGRFLELGKRDYYADSKIGLRPFRRNVSYFGIDADQLLVLHPELSRRMLTEIGALFEEGVFSALPYRAFNHDEISDAFRLMQNAGHIGKIVVLPPKPGVDRVVSRASRKMEVDPDGAHLVVGGIGGFGLVAAEWLVEKGARHIALCSRRGVADAETLAAIEHWRAAGVEAHIFACDVTRKADVEKMLTAIRKVAPLKSVVHAAMVLDDALVGNLNRERNQPVIDVKAKGAANLDWLTRADRLDNFILFSSVTTLVGNPGQANYVAANGYLEGLARARRSAGLPALAVGFGAIADAGYLARNSEIGQRLDRRLGKTAIGSREALQCVEDYIASAPDSVEAAVVMVSEFDWGAAHHLRLVGEDLFEVVMRRASHHAGGSEGGEIDLVAMTEGKAQAEAQDILFDIVAQEIASILRVSRESLSKDSVLKEIGLDSLMAVELGLNFEQNTGFDMPLSSLADNATVGDITRRLYEKVRSRSDTEDTAAEGSDDMRIFDELSRRHGGADQEGNSDRSE